MATGMGNSAPALSAGSSQGDRSRPRGRSPVPRNHGWIPEHELGGIVQGEIIPRLLMAHARAASPARTAHPGAITAEEAESFAPLACRLEADELLAEVERFLGRGVSVEAVFVELLATSARRLGDFWEEDSCDFVDVTMGLWRLQEVMREIALRSPAIVSAASARPSALFAPIPGDQHSFGALMVEEVFARAGWQSEVLFEPRRRELLRCLADRSFDLAGLTVSCDCPSGALADLISAIRSVSRNPAIRVIIGGRTINASPCLVAEVGADGTAPDAQSALSLAERLVSIAQLPADSF